MRMKKGQAWSLDALIGIALFIGAFLVILGYLATSDSKEVQLEHEAEHILEMLATQGNSLAVLDAESINESMLSALYSLPYDSIKRSLRTEYDFCIFLEDESGNTIFFNETTSGKGSDIINVSDIPCNIG